MKRAIQSERPIVIVGAGRSGTNALRDAISELQVTTTWPCDEINYIWRHGNRSFPTDQLTRAEATPEVKTFIRAAFDRQATAGGCHRVLEKTCANSLRVGFVDEVLPDARFVHIVRDGRDVVSSAMSRWKASLDLRYIAAKARYVPPSDLPYYGVRYLNSHVHRLRTGDKTLSTWGPRFEGMDEMNAEGATLQAVCAAQWAACVEASYAQLDELPGRRVIEIRYEDLVTKPVDVLTNVLEFVDLDAETAAVEQAASSFRAGSAGAWRERLGATDLEEIERYAGSTLSRLGYVEPTSDGGE